MCGRPVPDTDAACSAPLTAVADRIAAARQFRFELPPRLRCPQWQAVIIASAT